jgi:hypothetical protein
MALTTRNQDNEEHMRRLLQRKINERKDEECQRLEPMIKRITNNTMTDLDINSLAVLLTEIEEQVKKLSQS